MTSLFEKIRDPECQRCNLYKTAQSPCLIGQGPYPSEIMFIGEAPGMREDDVQRPFSGKAGRNVLDPILEELKISRDDIFISNTVLCRPPDNRTPSWEEVQKCSFWRRKELRYVKPQKIICLGATALRGILNDPSLILKDYLGKVKELEMDWGKVKVLLTTHPAYVLRNPSFHDVLKSHVKSFLSPKSDSSFGDYEKWDQISFLNHFYSRVSFDIETTDLDPRRGEIISIAASPKKAKSYWLDMKSQRDWKELREIFKSSERIIGHNLKFDLGFLITKNYLNRNILFSDKFFDTLLAYNILDENALDKGLKTLSKLHTSMPEYSMPENFDDVDVLRNYNCQDSDSNFRLYNWISKKLQLEPSLKIPLSIDNKTMAVITDFEIRGVKIDLEALKEMEINLSQKLEKLKKEVPVDNINSPKQIGSLLRKGGFKLSKTDKGNFSVGKAQLLALLDQNCSSSQKKLLENLLNYRKYFKLYSAFVVGLKDRMIEDKVYPKYYIAKREDFRGDAEGTVTGRLSSKDPNLQQIPRDKEDLEPELNPRRLFIPSSPNRIIMSADFSQIEMVMAGIYHDEPKLLEMFETGEDIHTQVAAEVFDVTLDNVSKDQRKFAKTINFGVLYGISSFGLAQRLGWTSEEAENFIARYFKKFPNLAANIRELKRDIMTSGYAESYFRRKRRLPYASYDSSMGKASLRQGINFPIQSSASDLTKICMWEIFKELKDKKSFLIGAIHDEILLEVDKSEKKEVIDCIISTFRDPPLKQFGVEPFPLKLRGEIEWGKNWLDLEKNLKF